MTAVSAETSFSAADHRHMARALALAARGLWTTSPNPRVGCVLVAGDTVIGEGWHQRAGEPHAEINALQDARTRAPERIPGSTAYVTLEPCAHTGRTPPCCDALIAARVGRVISAMVDPNPLVAGRGLAALRRASVEVASGLCAGEAEELNIGFVSRMTRNRPWVRVKLAATVDGRTALAGGESQWITGPAAREDGHRFRARACAILTGSGTVSIDNPQLTVRIPNVGRQPRRVVIDGALRASPQARVFAGGGTLVATAFDDPASVAELSAVGAEVIRLPGADGRVDLQALLGELASRGVNELHVEAGPRLAGALMSRGLVDELLLYLAPGLIGDTGRGLIALPALDSLSDRVSLRWHDIRQIGDVLRVIARVN